MKDFANSYTQKHWEFAVMQHRKMKEWLAQDRSNALREYAENRIAELEATYPQLKKQF